MCGRGSNVNGQLGLGDTMTRATPEKIVVPKCKAVSGGRSFSQFIDVDGCVWVCGGNAYGQLGLGHKIMIVSTPCKIESISDVTAAAGTGYSSIFLNNNGFIYTCGDNSHGQLGIGLTLATMETPIKVENMPKIASVGVSSVAYDFFACVDVEGDLWCVGYNGYGQLGFGDTRERVIFEKVTTAPKVATSKQRHRTKSARNHHRFEKEI